MGTTKAELTPQGELKLLGSVDTRLPVITDGLVAHYPFDNTIIGENTGNLYIDNTIWDDSNIVNGGLYPINDNGLSHKDLMLEAMIYLTNTPTERYTVLQTRRIAAGTSVYLSIDSSLKVSVYDHYKASNGYHASNQTLELNRWYKIAHLETETQTIIIIDGVIDRVINNAYDGDGSAATLAGDMYIGAESSGRRFQGIITGIKVGTCNPYNYTESNNTSSHEGIYIEEASSNMLQYPSDFSLWTLSRNSGSLPTVTNNVALSPNGDMTAAKFFIPNDGTYPRISSNFTPLNTNTHTISIYLASSLPNQKVTIGIFRNSPWNSVQSVTIIDVKKEWDRYEVQFNPLDTSPHQIYIGSHDSTKGMELYIWHAQLENLPMATAYTEISRSKGSFYLSKPFKGDSGTLYIDATVKNNNSPTVNYKTLYSNVYSSNAFFTIMNNSNGKLYGYYPNTAGVHTYFEYLNYIPSYNDRFNVTITWNVNEFKAYLNGVLTYTGTDCDGARIASSITELYIGTKPGWDNIGLIHNMSIYDRALVSNEVYNLVNNSFDLKETGDLVIPGVKAKPNFPEDIVLFPLDFDEKDEYKVISSSFNDVPIYENGIRWVGEGYTNVVPNIQVGASGWSNGNVTATLNDIEAPDGTMSVTKLTTIAADQARSEFNPSNPVADTWYTFSVYAKRGSTPYAGLYTYMAPESSPAVIFDLDLGIITSDTTDTNEQTTIESIGGGWYRISMSVLVLTGQTYRIFKLIQTNSPTNASGGVAGEYVYYWGPQFTATPYLTPFSRTTVTNGRLEYSFPSLISNDNNWTVGVWAKTNVYNMTNSGRISVIEVGDYYDVNEADIKWGRWNMGVGSGDEGKIGLVGYVNQTNHFITNVQLTREDYTNMSLYVIRYDSVNNIAYGKIYGHSGIIYETQVTTDLIGLLPKVKLGGYNWDTDCWDGYLRDFFVIDRALTDEELLNIAKNKMEQLPEGLRVLSNIETGIELG